MENLETTEVETMTEQDYENLETTEVLTENEEDYKRAEEHRKTLFGGLAELKQYHEEITSYCFEELEYVYTGTGFHIILPDKSVIDSEDLIYECEIYESEDEDFFSTNYRLKSDPKFGVALYYSGKRNLSEFGPHCAIVSYRKYEHYDDAGSYCAIIRFNKYGHYAYAGLPPELIVYPLKGIRACDEREITGKCGCIESCEWEDIFAWQHPDGLAGVFTKPEPIKEQPKVERS
ncbi:hypothetical protein [uncultured Pontibacter sp.]|uniref:hypothetical protein n=1 Tax=uncultured Pontibacter sp. TaxID=453356 RepID=UPI00261A60A9|nr:hypothetical protein [uncultured Pontibacter sp.]